jgi:hypothetical protein
VYLLKAIEDQRGTNIVLPQKIHQPFPNISLGARPHRRRLKHEAVLKHEAALK